MGVEWNHPWALLLLPLCLGLVLWIDRRYQRRVRSLKKRVSLWVRLALVTVMVLSIGMPSVLLPNGESATWVLLDVSDSTASAQSAMQEWVSQALARKPANENVGVISFGADAMVEMPMTQDPHFSGLHTAVQPDGSHLTDALRLASALLPAESSGRLLVISDGQTDDASGMVAGLKARGITVDTLEVPSADQPDAQVTQVAVPAEVYEGNGFSIQVTVDSNLETTGTLVLYQNGIPTATRRVELRKGENLFAFQDVAEKTGVVTYEARLQADGDHQAQNNSASAYLYALGSPQVLVVEGKNGSGEEMVKMLTATGFHVARMAAEELPIAPDPLRQYDALVLANVDFDAATQTQWSALETAVRLFGRGLCVLGGDSSYALGGYRGTVLETMLPVTIDVRNKLQMPALSLMLVIDKSGSMTSGQFGTTRLEVAKEAAMRSTEVLMEKDQVGVIAFDDAAKWVVPLQKVTDVAAIQESIGTIRPGGGTAFYSALEQAVGALMAVDTPQKHIIFLSDGEPGDGGFEQLALLATQNDITLTTVAVGSGANTKLMELLSTIGGGRAYRAGEFDNIPKIFTKETFLAGGTYVQNREFTPIITETSPLTAFDGFPRLQGYLTTMDKPLATVSMISDREDPLLAWWPYGAGTVLAWTSDAQGSWTKSFLMWENAAAFFGGLVGKTFSQDTRDGDVEVKAENGTAHVRYTLPQETSGQEELQTNAVVLRPDGTQEAISLTQTDAGVYEGEFLAGHQGAYALRVEQQKESETVRVKEGGAVVSFAEEYDLRKEGEQGVLSALTTQTGGRILGAGDEPFAPQAQGYHSRRQLTTLLCTLAMILLLLDIALRRLAWEPMVMHWLGKQQEKAAQPTEKWQRQTAKQPTKPERNKGKSDKKADPRKTTDQLLAAKRQRKQQ